MPLTSLLSYPHLSMRLVTAAIIRKENTVLLARRAAGQKLAGFWEFPGGKVEDGETIEQCLIREICEELGVPCSAGAILCESDYKYEHGSFRIVAIEAFVGSEDFRLNVHDEVAWLRPDRMAHVQLLPADNPIVETLIKEMQDAAI